MTTSRRPGIAALLRDLDERLRASADPVRAANERAYLKSDLRFLGVSAAPLRRAVSEVARAGAPWDARRRWAFAHRAWATRVHEFRASVVVLLERQAMEMGPDEAGEVEALLRDSRTWAYVDTLATHVAGPVLERRGARDRTLERWARDPDFWIRRSALLALLRPERAGGVDFRRFERLAAPMLDDREFFIRKAIGWVLREVGKRHPERTYDFLRRHRSAVAGLTLREGARYLPSAWRRELGLPAVAPPRHRDPELRRRGARRERHWSQERYTQRTVRPRPRREGVR